MFLEENCCNPLITVGVLMIFHKQELATVSSYKPHAPLMIANTQVAILGGWSLSVSG